MRGWDLKPLATELCIRGNVTLDAIVNVDGTVTVAEIVRRLGYGLDEAAIQTVQNLKCIAGEKDGKFFSATMQLVIEFRLN
jgi:TonB family protein